MTRWLSVDSDKLVIFVVVGDLATRMDVEYTWIL